MNHTRHEGIFNIPAGFSVTLIGAGGIGATTALTLAKMGVQTMVFYDDDLISDVNLPTQLHCISDVGDSKVLALGRTLALYTDELDFYPRPVRLSQYDTIRSTLVISAVDSISARQAIWKALNDNDSSWQWYIDGRMAAEELQLFVVCRDDPDAMSRYEAHLMGMDESSAEELPCTMKATFFTSLLAAGSIGAQVRNMVRGEAKSQRLVHVIPDNWLETFNI